MIQYWWRELKTNAKNWATLREKLENANAATGRKTSSEATEGGTEAARSSGSHRMMASVMAAARKLSQSGRGLLKSMRTTSSESDFRRARADRKVELRNDLMEINKSVGEITVLELLSFMYDTYEPRYWWFECFDYIRRLALTGLMVILKPGTALQGFIGVLIAVAGLISYIQFKPFKEDASDWMGVTAQVSTFFIFLSALMIQVNAVYHRAGFAKLLVVVTLIPPFISLCWACHAFSRTWKMLDAEEQKDHEKDSSGRHETNDKGRVKADEEKVDDAESSPTSPLHSKAPPQEDATENV